MLLKFYNTEFDEIIITFTDQNRKLLEVEGKVNLNQEKENMLKDIDFYHLPETYQTNIKNNYWIQDYFLKIAFKKVVHKTGEFLGNKVVEKL